MAIGTPVSLGVALTSSQAANSISTTAVTPSGALLVAVIHAIDQAIPSNYTFTVSGGGLTWQQDAFLEDTLHATSRTHIFWSAPAPSGLASSTSITITPTNDEWGWQCELIYIEGVETSASRTDGTAHAFASTPTTWTTGSGSVSGDSAILIAGAVADGASGGHVIDTDSPATELVQQFGASNTWLSSTSYRIVSSSGSYTVTGTLTSTAYYTESAWVAYKEGVAAEPEPEPSYQQPKMMAPGLRGPGRERNPGMF